MMQTYEFDDAVLSPQMFRFHVLRVHGVSKHLLELSEKQNDICPICKRALFHRAVPGAVPSQKVEVDHIIPVKWFAVHVEIPLTEAYLRCHALENLRAIHKSCHRLHEKVATLSKNKLSQWAQSRTGRPFRKAKKVRLTSASCPPRLPGGPSPLPVRTFHYKP